MTQQATFTLRYLGWYLEIGQRSWWGRRRWMKRPLEERIAIQAQLLREELGVDALPSLAAAEAVELGREHGLRFDHVEYDNERVRWTGHYETGPVGRSTAYEALMLSLPLPHTTEATQRGIATLN